MIPEHRHLGATRFPSDLTDVELDFFFTLDDAELELVRRRRRDLNRVGLALQLGFLKMTGGGMPVSERVPAIVLAHVCAQLSAGPIDIASVASMYRRRATRFAHQAEAARFLGLSEMGPGGRAGLVRHLNAEAATDPDPKALWCDAHMWMHTRNYLMIGSRASGDIVGQVISDREKRLSRMIARSWTGAPGWVATLAEHVVPNVTRLEWLSAGPRRKSLAALEEQVGKISCLKAMGAGRIDLDGLADVAIARHARSVVLRKASVLRIYKEPGLRIAIACFLERQLRIQTDSAIDLYNHLVNDLVRRAHDRGMERVARSAASVANLVVEIERLAVDPDVSVEDVQARLLALIAPFRGPGALAVSRTQAMREELSAQLSEIRRLLRIFDAIDLEMPPEHPLTVARAVITSTGTSGSHLPDAIDNPFGSAWAGLIAAEDRKTAFTSWCAATALLIKRSLRNGSASIPHSRTWQDPDRHLISGAFMGARPWTLPAQADPRDLVGDLSQADRARSRRWPEGTGARRVRRTGPDRGRHGVPAARGCIARRPGSHGNTPSVPLLPSGPDNCRMSSSRWTGSPDLAKRFSDAAPDRRGRPSSFTPPSLRWGPIWRPPISSAWFRI